MAKSLSPAKMNSHLVGDNINTLINSFLETHPNYVNTVFIGFVKWFTFIAVVVTIALTLNHYFDLPVWVVAIFAIIMKGGIILSKLKVFLPLIKILANWSIYGKLLWVALKTSFLLIQGSIRFFYTGLLAKVNRIKTVNQQFSTRDLTVSTFNKEVYFNAPEYSPLRKAIAWGLTLCAVLLSIVLATDFVAVLGKLIHVHLEPGLITTSISFLVLLWFFTWIPELVLNSNQRQAIRFSSLRPFVNGQRGFFLHQVMGGIVKSILTLWKPESQLRLFSGEYWKETGMAGYHAFLTAALNPEKFGLLVEPVANTWQEKFMSPFQQLQHIAPQAPSTDDLNQELVYYIPYGTRYVLVPCDAVLTEADIVGPDYQKATIVKFESVELIPSGNFPIKKEDQSLPWYKVSNYKYEKTAPLITLEKIRRNHTWTFIFENE